MRVRCPRWFAGLGLWCALVGCRSTVDSLGYDQTAAQGNDGGDDAGDDAGGGAPNTDPPPPPPPPPPKLTKLVGPAAYPNPFHEQLGLPTADIDQHVEDVFQQLFHGDATSEAIYFTTPEGDASIKDILHGDVRTEGVGLGMLVTVELDKREEFDKLWSYALRVLRIANGANEGYFNSHCDTPPSTAVCLDPYGMQHFAMALIFAHDRWGSDTTIDYEHAALGLLDTMLNKQEQNGGITEEGVTNLFDAETKLVFDEPKVTAASRTRPSILMPAFYELWSRATENTFFADAADAARNYFPTVADSKTGLMPLRSYFDGTPVPGASDFNAEAYRAQLNLVLDQIWTPGDAWGPTECGRVLSFFVEQGLGKYVGTYELDGTPTSTMREVALVLVNGATAVPLPMSFSADDRRALIQAVWDMPVSTGDVRYYQGMMHLFALLVLSGKMQVL